MQQLPEITDEHMQARLAKTRDYTLVILHTTPKTFTDDGMPIIWEHGRLNMRLMDAGILAVVMPVAEDCDIAGIQVFTVGTDEARTVMDADPGVAAGIFSYDIHPVRAFFGSAPDD